jgi:hypothetical protein
MDNEISPGACGSPRWSEVPLGSGNTEKLDPPCDKVDEKTLTSQERIGLGDRKPELPTNSYRTKECRELSSHWKQIR